MFFLTKFIFFFFKIHYFCFQMRIVVFFVSLFFLLVGAKDSSFAANCNSHVLYSSAKTFVSKLNAGFMNEDFDFAMIDDTDLDEDYLTSHDVTENKLFLKKYNIQNIWFLPKFCSSTIKSCNNRFKIFSNFCGYSYPIYISQRVLRI
ncbi:conserved exported hypothetical protein [Flavobacterium psychrophilum]|nr:hypothetical protein FPSM_01330 [Flavobacterium psychrophilum]SNA31051.1 conserved hypothetical protein [Flavobacterium psychrophilum]SNA83042.1 conserved hypothetical protein [Flavobacterium psychrophilum]SNB02272.1 conserved exported hypothetical protein [Flavobacterium psychrophilum]SNB13041.1 conserved hypothetical protein [Flavobacterium psychrophilum]